MINEPSRLNPLRARLAAFTGNLVAAAWAFRFRFAVAGIVAGIIQLLGISAIVAGFFLIAPYLGLFATGIGLFIIARAIDPPQRPTVMEVE